MPTTEQHEIYGRTFGGNAAENYERFFVAAIGRPFAADLVATAKLRPGERVLDVACGTGIVTRLAAERVAPNGSVAGADINAGMLDVARRVGTSAPVAIQWYETSAEAMPLPDQAFDAVLCQFGLQFMTDKSAALRQMYRVLAPAGRIVVSLPTPNRFFDTLDQVIDQHGIPAAAAFVRVVFAMNDPVEVERLFREAGFATVDARPHQKELHLPAPSEFFWQYIQSTPLSSTFAELDHATRTAIERGVVAKWQEWLEDGELRHLQPILVVTARK